MDSLDSLNRNTPCDPAISSNIGSLSKHHRRAKASVDLARRVTDKLTNGLNQIIRQNTKVEHGLRDSYDSSGNLGNSLDKEKDDCCLSAGDKEGLKEEPDSSLAQLKDLHSSKKVNTPLPTSLRVSVPPFQDKKEKLRFKGAVKAVINGVIKKRENKLRDQAMQSIPNPSSHKLLILSPKGSLLAKEPMISKEPVLSRSHSQSLTELHINNLHDPPLPNTTVRKLTPPSTMELQELNDTGSLEKHSQAFILEEATEKNLKREPSMSSIQSSHFSAKENITSKRKRSKTLSPEKWEESSGETDFPTNSSRFSHLPLSRLLNKDNYAKKTVDDGVGMIRSEESGQINSVPELLCSSALGEYSDKLGGAGVWPSICHYLKVSDLVGLCRVSNYFQHLVEPLIYTHIRLEPRHPYGYYFTHLSKKIKALLTPRNRQYISRFTISLKVSGDWEVDSTRVEERELDSDGEIRRNRRTREPLKPHWRSFSQRLESIPRHGDGGLKELNQSVAAFIVQAQNLREITWTSIIPLRSYVYEKIGLLPGLKQLSLNLRQPWFFERARSFEIGRAMPFNLTELEKYRASINRLNKLNLVRLELFNLPIQNQGWWKMLMNFILSMRNSLRHLTLEVKPINSETYPSFFDDSNEYITFIPEYPPVISWGLLNSLAAERDILATFDLSSLKLIGFIVDQKFINWEVNPVTLKKLTLIGCWPGKFELSDAHAANLTTFITDSWEFLPAAAKVVSRFGNGRKLKKEIIFKPKMKVPDIHKQNFLRTIVFSTRSMRVLCLTKDCTLTDGMLYALLNPQSTIEELTLPVAKSQWHLFMRFIGLMKNLTKVVVLGDGNPVEMVLVNRTKGVIPHERFPRACKHNASEDKVHMRRHRSADDAEDIVERLRIDGTRLAFVGRNNWCWRVVWDEKENWRLVLYYANLQTMILQRSRR